MNRSILNESIGVEQSKLLIVFIVIFSFFLNQSNVLYGVNISFTDFFLIFIMMFMIINKDLYLPKHLFVFFLLLSIYLITISIFLTPTIFNIHISGYDVLISYSKLLILFLYFIVGYSLRLLDIRFVAYIYKYFSYTAVIIGVIGIMYNITSLQFMKEILFLDNRFKGFMNDPNYFAVVQLIALAYFLNKKGLIHNIFKYILVFSIILSGSKTGFITLVLFLSYKIILFVFNGKFRKNKVFPSLIFASIISLLFLIFYDQISFFITSFSLNFSVISRIESIFQNFNTALFQSGSGRSITWEIALSVIKEAPVIGVGIGTYLTITDHYFNFNQLAHNTYLQIFAEWGILSVILLILIMRIFFSGILKRSNLNKIDQITLDIIFIFGIASFGISLNNSRILWLILGVLFSVEYISKRSR